MGMPFAGACCMGEPTARHDGCDGSCGRGGPLGGGRCAAGPAAWLGDAAPLAPAPADGPGDGAVWAADGSGDEKGAPLAAGAAGAAGLLEPAALMELEGALSAGGG